MAPEKRMHETASAPARSAHTRGDSGDEIVIPRRGMAGGATRLSTRGKTVLTPKGFPLYL